MEPKLNMKSFIGNLLFIAVLLLIMTRFISVWSGTPFPLNLISAGSMNPTLMKGDIIAWTPTNIDDVEVGDVIVFKSWLSWPGEKFIVHRVVDIKSVWGKPAFVTKGDANEYTDQSGPHIVEPYVTDENYVGKVLSINKQPLKIPLVGIIGIWINDGFKSLAQPTSSKGSLAYVGVFTPLTIAVILLIISLVVLPEKTKNIKEKIRLLIFGSRTLNIKKTFVMFLIIYILLLSVIHIFAYDSTSASFGIGEFPNKSPFEMGSISPGSTSHPKNLPAANPSILPVKGMVLGSGNLAPYVNGAIFEMKPGETKKIPITLSAPQSSKNGSYVGNIRMYSSPIWLIFPDELMKIAFGFGAEGATLYLDILSAWILTTGTVLFIALAEYMKRKYVSLKIDRSWQHISKLYLRGSIIKYVSYSKVRKGFYSIIIKRIGWFSKLNLAEIDPKKPIIASLVIIPALLIISSEIFAAIIASIIAGLVAFFISCKIREKIVLSSVLSLSTATIYIIIKTSYSLLVTSKYNMLETTALGVGLISIYLLILVFLLVPISLISWYTTHIIRNLKELKDPLLILDGRCNL